MLRFEHPEYLYWLIAIPVFAVGYFFLYRYQKKILQKFVSDVLFPQLAPAASRAKRIIKQSFFLLALAFLIIAWANPQVGTRIEEVKREGIDMFIALDVSLSMKAEDIRPSRLEKAKRDVSALIKKLTGDRVGMIVFAGDAFVQFPLTADYGAADLFISAIDVDAVPVPGTMIGSAIEMALRSFSKDVPTQKAIVIVSDGENTEGDFMSAVEDAKNAGVRIYTVGMGTPEGGPIPIYDANGNRVDYKRDAAGSIVLSKLDESALQQIAANSGGSYHRATSGGNEIDDIFKELASLEKAEFGTKQVAGFESRYQYPLFLSFILFIIEFLLSAQRGKLLEQIKRLFPMTILIFGMMLSSSLAFAQTVRSHINEGNKRYEKGDYTDAEAAYKKALEKDATSKEAQFNLGNSYYKQQRFDEAMRSYANAGTAMKAANDRAAALYNLGNALYRANKFQESAEAYRQALRLNPNDEDARYNFQMAREKMKQQQQQQQQQNKEKNQQDQQQQQKQQQQNNPQQQKNEQAKQDQTRPQVQKKNQMPKEEADRILEAMRNNEKEIQKNLRKREAVKVKVEKDW